MFFAVKFFNVFRRNQLDSHSDLYLLVQIHKNSLENPFQRIMIKIAGHLDPEIVRTLRPESAHFQGRKYALSSLVDRIKKEAPKMREK